MLALCRLIQRVAPAQDGHPETAPRYCARDRLRALSSLTRGRLKDAVMPSTAQKGFSRAPAVRASSNQRYGALAIRSADQPALRAVAG